MKRKVLTFAAFIFFACGAFAQGEMDAYKLSQTDLTGTARSVSMGGAMGALGGDISAVAINPAGIGIYKSSEVVTTLNFQNTGTKIETKLGKFDDTKFKFNFDNLAFVATFPVNSDVAPLINFGFSYNRLKNYDRKYSMEMDNPKYNLADYMARRANLINFGDRPPHDELWFQDDNDTKPLDRFDWLAVFGYNSKLINLNNNNRFSVLGELPQGSNQYLFVREKGSVNTYDFNVGTTFSDIVSAGLTISVTDMKYRLYSELDEDYGDGNWSLLRNDLETEGTGVQVGVGIIVKPTDALRIGVAYHSPTWYNMTDYYGADFDYDLRGFSGLEEGWISTNLYRYDYRLRTPDKWAFSLAGFLYDKGPGLFPKVSLSADYELTNYNNMKLHDDYGDPLNDDPNEFIKEDFRMASTLRVGTEVRFTNQFSMRAGYSWRQSPLKKEFRNKETEVVTVGSITHFTLDGDTNYFTYGLGYRFTRNFYSDIAFVMRTQKSDLYTFDDSANASWKDNTFQGLLTLGFRF